MYTERRIIDVEVIDFARGSISIRNDQRHFVAVERAPGIYRVNDGTYDFTFTQLELDSELWIKEV